MRRVLVAQNVGLWIRLNRHLSGVGAVDLVETPTLETGRLLAQLERPAIVVFSDGAGRIEAQELVADLKQRGCRGTHVVVASDELEPTSRPFRPDGAALVICPEDDLGRVVTELLALNELPQETIDLLVHYEKDHEDGSDSAGGFVVVLDLAEKSLLLQADKPLEIDSELSLNFFLPAAAEDLPRDKVLLVCRIESCPNETDLIYTASVSDIDAEAAASVRRFLAKGSS